MIEPRTCNGCYNIYIGEHGECPRCKKEHDTKNYQHGRSIFEGKHGAPTLDMQEGNWEEWH